MEYLVLPNPAAVARHAADLVEGEVTHHSDVLVGLAGGSTPKAAYHDLAHRPIDWSSTTAWMTDERWVPPDDDESNQKMARASLVDATGVAFLAPETTLGSIVEAAAGFSEVIVPVATTAARSIVLLGIGTDGHTASLFPGSAALDDGRVAYVANHVPSLDTWRLTATFGLLATAHVIVFLVTGESKAPMVAAIANGTDVPSARVTARDQVLWLLDDAAASGLRRN